MTFPDKNCTKFVALEAAPLVAIDRELLGILDPLPVTESRLLHVAHELQNRPVLRFL
ncbi:hypothetical protein PSAC2689_10492 [Paraburkholderia sacchari]